MLNEFFEAYVLEMKALAIKLFYILMKINLK